MMLFDLFLSPQLQLYSPRLAREVVNSTGTLPQADNPATHNDGRTQTHNSKSPNFRLGSSRSSLRKGESLFDGIRVTARSIWLTLICFS